MNCRNVLAALLLLCSPLISDASALEKIEFWDTQRKGANCFNEEPTEAWFDAAQKLGVQWVRLAFDKWKGKERDFLMGNADAYRGVVREDMDRLRTVLDWAAARGMKVVIAPLGLPGNRWVQLNGGKRDLRLWNDRKHWQEAALYWRQIAADLKGHPAVIGYNILNEPTPEMGTGLDENGPATRYIDWYAQHRGTPRDLVAFYETVIAAIREADAETPIMLDSGWYAQPDAFVFWPKISDDKVLYAVHMYEPYAFTNHKNFSERKGYVYPGRVPFGDEEQEWNRRRIEEHFVPFLKWAKERGIPATRLVVAEFGCYRRNKGAGEYFRDLLDVFDEHGLHWAFYAFREDGWDGMDYELGAGGLGDAYWKAKEAGESPEPPRKDNPLFDVIRKEFER